MNNYDHLKEYFSQEYFKKNSFLGHNNKTAIVFGNGITRLALNSPSWYGWVKNLWEDIKPEIPFEYMQLREVTLPECIQYLIDTTSLIEKTEESEKARKLIYKSLWNATENIDLNQVMPDIHKKCVHSFKIFFTTNYDTLLERICLKNQIGVDVHVRNADNSDITPVELKPEWTNRITLVKLHGSFPLNGLESRFIEPPNDKIFEDWWDNSHKGKTIVAGVREYSNSYASSVNIIDKLRQKSSITDIQYLIFMGYGMKSEDDIVVQLSKRIGVQTQVAMTYGGDTIDDLRYEKNWSIKHISIPATRGGGREARIKAHYDFLQYVTEPIINYSSCNTYSPQCIVVGQASVVNVVRISEPPAQERSYRITEGPAYPKDKNSHKYTTRYVAGQMLTPTLLLDRWNLKSLFVSLIGYDESGLKIRNELINKNNIDWSYILQDNRVITDNSFVVTHDEFRTVYDSGLDFEKTKDIIQDTFRKISGNIENKQTIPSLIYLCKWYLEDLTYNEYLKGWIEKGKYPLVCYETGAKGSNPDSRGDFYIERKIGIYCDVMLASSLFVMRAFKMPLFDIESKKISQEFDLKIPLAEWDAEYNSPKYQRFNYQNRASQNLNFVLGLNHLRENEIIRLLFESQTANDLFPNVSWWIVTLGDIGMVAISKHDEEAWWIKPQTIGKKDILNALGCGDVSRGAFIGYYLKRVYDNEYQNSDYDKNKYFLKEKNVVLNAVKCAVYAGTEKIKYFNLNDALSELSWDTIEDGSNNLIAKRLNSHTLDEMSKLVV
jgi:sugar/nucleoside kinase (ribokinase family)